MCYDLHHHCQYCHNEYACNLDDNICPSLNYDVNRLMCDDCEKRISDLADEITFNEIRKKFIMKDENGR